ncbi:hypothetical protein X727_32845 [Mesorhizobium sp. L103C119B0]|uniref:hypothetical protein n=1 Tax=Mesorhizobium sp. L103C119B0 TaxID=1287085 RepID=UPI0003D05194|nr:hypothetical protein [Mesorhizobium sp. L103C119B0]ESZ56656.1 hypothetical protein X727_32845 [Mesorhizobium sp. L103C119B0]
MGFFWIVVDRNGLDAILADTIGLADAEHYGELLTHPGGHYDYWEAMKKRGPIWLRARNLSTLLLQTEYEVWPRGRVVYSLNETRAIVYADPRIRTKRRIELVRAAFQTPHADLVIRKDSHYRPSMPFIVPDDHN